MDKNKNAPGGSATGRQYCDPGKNLRRELSDVQRAVPKPAPKWMRTLREVLGRSSSTDPRAWLNRFLAERICRDHTLPSTISELERTKGLRFERKDIEVAGYAGETARVMAYRVAPESIERARELLGMGGAT